jgi:hypothetical protein
LEFPQQETLLKDRGIKEKTEKAEAFKEKI